MVFPMWVSAVVAVVIVAIDYTQTQTTLALSPEIKFAIGLISAIAGVLASFQKQATQTVRKALNRP